jgi:hypothetical protein
MSRAFTLRVLGPLLLVVLNLGAIELLSCGLLRYGVLPRDPSLLYEAPSIDESEFRRYLRIRHPQLGWPGLEEGGDPAAVHSRPIPAFPDSDSECVSLYGDSYTYGDEVEDAEAWSNQLSIRLGCRVANFGVGGYGTDQALLRFQMNGADDSSVAVLGIYPYNILRNVNQYRRFLGGPGGSLFSFKPRFILEGDELILVPLPKPSFQEIQEMVQEPGRHLQAEAFVPGTAPGPPLLSFPHSLAFLKLLFSDTIQNFLFGRPSWSSFLDEDHRSQALQVTAGIGRAFDRLARERGKASMVVMFPTVSSYEYLRDRGVLVIRPLVERLEASGVTVLDLHREIVDRLGEESYCGLLMNPAGCSGHYSPVGNALVAEIVGDHLRETGLLE